MPLSTLLNPVTPPAAGDIEELFSNNTQLQDTIINMSKTYGFTADYCTAFFSVPTHRTAIISAANMYGIPGNYPGIGYRNQYGWCAAYAPVTNFYWLAFLFSKYPQPVAGQEDCQVLKGYISSLDNEKINADTRYAGDADACTHNSALKAIADIQGLYMGIYNNLSCDVKIRKQTDADALATALALGDHATANQIQAQIAQAELAGDAATLAHNLQNDANDNNAGNVANVAGTGAKGTNTYMVYVIMGIALLIAGGAVVVFNNKKK